METPCEPPTVHDAKEALQNLWSLVAAEAGAGTAATTIKDVESGSVETYWSARQALDDRPSEEPLLWVVERRLNVLAARGKSGSSTKVWVSGIRLLEKLHIIVPLIHDVHWMLTRAVAKRWARRVQPKPVATWDHIEAITTTGDIGCGADLCFWPSVALSFFGEWVMQPALCGNVFQCLDSSLLGTKSGIRRSPHTPSKNSSKCGERTCGSTDHVVSSSDRHWCLEDEGCSKKFSSRWSRNTT